MAGSYGPSHWEALYLQGRTPWDAGDAPADLRDHLRRYPERGRALVPGCGSGYEAATLAAAGFDVLAIDFSDAAVARARSITAGTGVRVEVADFFGLEDGDLRLVYERAFLCALPPRLRPDWATHCARLLAPGGLLAGLFFLGETPADGPPFAIPPQALEELLADDFERLADRPSNAPLPVFGDGERWQVWRRRAP
jgi:thiopurine S-methyltransferase